MNRVGELWESLTTPAKLGAVAALTVTGLATVAFAIGATAGGDATPGQRPGTPAASQLMPTFPPPPATHVSPKPTTAPTAEDDGANIPPPSGPADVIREAGTVFAARWLNTARTAGQWRAGMAELVTPELAAALADAEPETVPVGWIGSPVTVTVAADGLADVAVPVVGGLDEANPVRQGVVTLTLVERGGRWLVSEIDWSPA